MFERIIDLIGEDKFNKIKNTKILLVGVGGVGGFVFEGLIRSGFENITIIDHDKVEYSNINRQLVANLDTINEYKVDIAKDKALKINDKAQITALNMFLDQSNINTLDKDFDFIIDACDSLFTKYDLIKFAKDNNINVIASMGVGNRVDASNIVIGKLSKTYNDPLAKRLRKVLRDNHVSLNVDVVYSKELPVKKDRVDSMITSPGIAGLLIVNYIINKIIKDI